MSNIGSLQVTYHNVADIALAMKKFQEKAMPSMTQYQQILKNIADNSQQGLTNQNIRNYFVDVHSLINGTILTIFDAITCIINLYAYDLEKYDGSKEFIVIQEELEKKYPKYQHISDTFSNNHVIIKAAYDSISSYITEGLLDVSNITTRLDEMHSFFERMYQEIYDEGSSYGAKLIEINDLLHKLQVVINEAMKIEITSYDISKLAEIPHVSDLTNGVVAINNFMKANTCEIAQAAYSIESYQRLKDAEAKRKSLILDIAIAVAGAVAAVTAVILTGGAAAFVLVPAIALTTAVDVGFKVSDVVENESVIHKSRENDLSRGYNPIRETLFNGNQESYDQAKRFASTVSQATQFAAGFAGGVGLVGGLKTATTAAQKGIVFLKASGRALVKVGKEIGEEYIEETVIPGIASATSEFILMQNGYTRDQAKRIIGDKVDVSMKLLGLGGSVRGVVGGVHKYKTASDDFSVTLPDKNRKRKSVNELELECKSKCDIANIEDIKKRLSNSVESKQYFSDIDKVKTEVETNHNKGNVQHQHAEVTSSPAPDINTNTKNKKDLKDNRSHDIDSKKASDAVKMQQEKIDTALEVVKIQEMHTWTDFYKTNGGPGTKDLSCQEAIKKHLEQSGNTARVETTRDGHTIVTLLDSSGKEIKVLEGKYSGIEIGDDIDLKNYDRAITKEHLDNKVYYTYDDVVYTKDGKDYLHDNAKYYDKDNGMLYTTNDYGHVDMAIMTRDLVVPDMNDPKIQELTARDPKAAKDVVDNNYDDIGFHLLAKMLGGKGGIQNMISGDYTLNNTTWKSMESYLNKISKGDKVRFKMQPIYNNKNSAHPDKIIFECWVNGNKEIYEFTNGGQNE